MKIYTMSNEYDITQYSDEECYQMLELDNPTDRELEMKILQMMDKYEQKSKRLFHFFESMYDRFFGDDADEFDDVVEGFQNARGVDVSGVYGFRTDTKTDSEEFKQATALMTAPTPPVPTTVLTSNGNAKQGTQEVTQVDYVKGQLNPVERKTIFKMISVDSQFRDDPTNTLSTSFTMNLAEGIENVISMKLYSVQIPYTWYTVNSTFGSNFFYIKGNSPGIDNGNHDIKVEIDSGTYKPEEIATAINAKYSFMKNKAAIQTYITNKPSDTTYNPVLDMSLGNTQVTYNLGANNAKVVFEMDLKKQYDESNYYMYFPTWSSPDEEPKTLTIPSFLGYRFDTYYPYIAYSQAILPLIEGDTNSETNTSFYLTSANNYFTIRHYIGDTTIREIQITFSLATESAHSRNELIRDINAQLQSSPLIDPTYSSVTRKNVFTDKSRIEIAVKLNRNKVEQIENSKLQIIFPNETQPGNHIWTGTDSCFVYPEQLTVELSEIVSEAQSTLTNYIIDQNAAKIQIECTKPLYNVVENTRIATVPSSASQGFLNGYYLNNYIGAINASLATMNTPTISVYRPNGEFNINAPSNIYNTSFAVEQNLAKFKFDILREFTQSTYEVDLSGCFLSQPTFGFPTLVTDVTDTSYTLVRNYSTSASITITSTTNKIVLQPKTTGGPNGQGYGNQNVPPIELYFTTGTFSQIELFLQSVNNDLINFVDSDGYQIMSGASLSFTNGQLILVLRISKILTESNYKVTFIDNSSYNSWSNYLFFDSSYNLTNVNGNTYSEISGNSIVGGDLISLTSLNNTIVFKPYVDGVANGSGLNDITITVPVSSTGITEYTREGLIEAIQRELTANPLTTGSQISLLTINNLEYTKMRVNINKLYTAKDYKLVFYDAVSYVYCNVGVAQNVTWDATLGWLLGFHTFTEYALGDFLSQTILTDNYKDNVFTNALYGYANSVNGNKIALIGDTVLNTNLYNYFLVVLDDFIQNHVNAGLVTISSLENDLALPSYAVRATYQCDPVTGQKVAVSASNKLNTSLNSKQLYAMNQIVEAKRTKTKSYASGPYLKDVFALIPMKLTGMTFGQTYMEFGGTMQNQDRKYFGPVRIQKLSVKLMNDKGALLNLNGANWSFCIICEIMNKQPKA